MAKLIWGNVYYQGQFAGVLRQEPGERTSFTYDASYRASGGLAIAHTLPIQSEPFISEVGLHPFFDNLVAEGWMEEAQTRLLKKRQASRFELLLAFGMDCHGAVSVTDPEPEKLNQALVDLKDAKEIALMHNRASLSGVQPKLLIRKKGKHFVPTQWGEISTHIAKFPSTHHPDLIANEFLTSLAFKALLPNDAVCELQLGTVWGIDEPALIIKRFDRSPSGERIHFEEFSQLLGLPSRAKYEGSYKEMADFIAQAPNTIPAENYKLYCRILAGLLLGNTDMHFKNFAMLHTDNGLRLTPAYDQLASFIYSYKTTALTLGGAQHIPLGSLKAKHLITLGHEFNLKKEVIEMAWKSLANNKEAALAAIMKAELKAPKLKEQLVELIEKRWNGTFVSIGEHLSKKL